MLGEELCCKYEDGQSEFFRCDGSDYARTCDPDQERADAARAKEQRGDSVRVLDSKTVIKPLKRRKESLIATVVDQGEVGDDLDRTPRHGHGHRGRGRTPKKAKVEPEIRTFFVKKSKDGKYEVRKAGE